MVVITVHGKTVSGEEIVAVAVVIFVLCTHIVVTDCELETMIRALKFITKVLEEESEEVYD